MAYDVFVSHSAKDKATADAACACLEAEGIRCMKVHNHQASAAREFDPPDLTNAFRIGITGHRPNRLEKADFPLLPRKVRQVLTAVRSLLTHEHAALPTIVTPLAEGSDRIAAKDSRKNKFTFWREP